MTQETATDSQELTRQGQINELFTKAIDQLGAVNHKGEKQLEIRLGGIYALEWIARISEPHHWPIMEVLTAYVRAHAPAPPKDAQPTKCDQAPEEKSPATLSQPPSQVAAEIQAVLTVLGRRTRTYGKGEKKGEERLNLAETDLRPKAFLRRAEFEAVIFRGAWLEGADLRRAQLRGADFRGARLKDADFLAAHLEGAQNLTVEQLSTAKTLHEACLDPPLREQIQQRYPRLLEKP